MERFHQALTAGSIILMLVSMIPVIAIADSHGLTPSATVGNDPPVITSMALDDTSYDPTEASTTRVTLTFNVSDNNGVGDLDDSKVKVEVDDANSFASPVAKYTNTSCIVVQDISSTVRQYRCSWNMDYWDEARTGADSYSTRVTAGDNAGTVSNDTTTNAPTYDYTTLVATDIDSTSISFGSVTTGTENNPATENPTTLNNTGNANLYINITGADLTSNGFTYAIGYFSVDLDADPTGEQTLTTTNTQIAGASIPKGTDGTPSPEEELYWFADTPTGLNPATYTGSWTLTQYEQ